MANTEVRFWSNVDRQEGGCWPWLAGQYHNGYGRFWDGQRQVRAHRYAYELLVGPIPDGLQIDHLCRVRNCVNPDHLESVTARDNVLRGKGRCAINARKTHCKYGHEFSAENTGHRSDGRARWCRTCQKEWMRRYRERS